MHIIIQSLSIYILIEIQLVCNVVLISGVEQSDSDTYIYIYVYIYSFSYSFLLWFITEY